MCVHVPCVHVLVCTCMCMYVCVGVCACVLVCACVYMCVHMYASVYVHTPGAISVSSGSTARLPAPSCVAMGRPPDLCARASPSVTWERGALLACLEGAEMADRSGLGARWAPGRGACGGPRRGQRHEAAPLCPVSLPRPRRCPRRGFAAHAAFPRLPRPHRAAGPGGLTGPLLPPPVSGSQSSLTDLPWAWTAAMRRPLRSWALSRKHFAISMRQK